jgi:hypothetical protein
MSTSYPGGLDSYTTKIDGVDDVMASHINNPQDAIEAIEAELGTDPAGSFTDVVTRLLNMNAELPYREPTVLTDSSNNDSGVASNFRDNDNSYPDGWAEVDAAYLTNTSTDYSFWYLLGTSSDTSWKYRIQTDINVESEGADIYHSILFGPILFRDGQYGADIDYYFGIYRNNAGSIDETTFCRVHIYWDSGGTIDGTAGWFARGEEKDGSTQHNGAWFRLLNSRPPGVLFVRCVVRNNAAKTIRSYIAVTPSQYHDTQTQSQNPSSAPTWGQVWLQVHMSRGAGISDVLKIGAVDYLYNVS